MAASKEDVMVPNPAAAADHADAGLLTSHATASSAEAGSLDGRTFTIDGTRAASLLPGDIVVLRPRDGTRVVGQVLGDRVVNAIDGLVIGGLAEDGSWQPPPRRPFTEAAVEAATAGQLVELQRSRGAGLTIGRWSPAGVEVPARLRAQGFGRHTFMCGQSGSGKTYSLGVILEQLLLETGVRMVVLDPNADFLRLNQPRADAPDEAVRRLAATDIRMLSADSGAGAPLRMRFATMPRAAQAAVLRLDPLADRGEYNQFLHLMADAGAQEVDAVVRHLGQGGADERSLGERIENLGMLDWDVWAGRVPSAAEVVAGGARLTVLDLSGFSSPQEPIAVCLDMVEDLWARRKDRTPTLLVVDGAHNICPAEPSGSLQTALVERLIQIAAEGRKYGLWLLLSTQRPSKIHPQVLSQCDNLVLMRMNSPGDIADLAQMFGYAPEAMLRMSRFFSQGEALVAGGFVPLPALVQMGARLTVEGGSDVPVPLQRHADQGGRPG
jgi:uncharacterized protein